MVHGGGDGGVLVERNFLVAAFPSVTFVGLTTYQSAEHLTVSTTESG